MLLNSTFGVNKIGAIESKMDDLKWSKKEKSISRKAFDKAYHKECANVINTLKEKVAQLKNPEDIWDFKEHFDQRLKEIGRKYDYRYSILILVFAQLLKQGWIEIDDLEGLGAEKIDKIKSLATFDP